MRKSLLNFLLFLGASASCLAQKNPEKRALLIAIDNYSAPPGTKISGSARSLFTNLDGCINDARSIHTIVTNRFQFSLANVDTIYNEAANRQSILDAMEKLLKESEPGDVAFIYYAGHGSQVSNKARKDEDDQKDESMVPSDTWKPGVKDIRDKELGAIYNKFIDKGVKLTVIMDCCHSGSLSRGPGDPGRFRFIADPNYDVNDPTPVAPPEERPEGTFLIMSAAQDNEFAQEQRDENNMPHGAFTLAFIQALNQQSVDASAINLFTSIRAILKSNGRKQEPVLGGSDERQRQTIFGLSRGSVPDKSQVAISGISGDKVTLQGGFALGLYKENELVKFQGKDTLVKLRVDTVVGINKSIATVIKGDIKNLKAGEFLDVTNWVSSGAPPLKIYIPKGLSSEAELTKLVNLNKELKASTKIKWINDLQFEDPYASVFMVNDKYYINVDDTRGFRELKNLTLAEILANTQPDSTLYFELPPTREMAQSIRKKLSTNMNLSIVDNPDDANYVLFGTISREGKPSYGLRRSQVSSKDSAAIMPLQTFNFIAGEENVPDSLYEYAMRLFKVRGWLQLSGPKTDKATFPYSLMIRNDKTGQPVGAEGSKIGDAISLRIVADPIVNNPNFNPASVPLKYVYVFTINKMGKMTLLYPSKIGGNLHNRFPKLDNGKIINDFSLGEIEVEEPVGTDYLFLLATDEQITTYAMLFEQDGVRGQMRGEKGEAEKNPLGNILNIGNEKSLTRDFKPKTPSNWVLYKLQAKTTK